MLTEKRRTQLLNFLKSMNGEREKEFWKLFVDFFMKDKKLSEEEKQQLANALKENFYSVLDKMYYTEYELLRVKAKATKEELQKIQDIRIQAVKRRPGKKPKKWIELEVNYKHLIKQLRDKGLSWREISEYLKKYNKKKYSPAYLMKFYKETFKHDQEV